MNQIHVLHLIDGLNIGGAEILLRDLTIGLVQRGYRVSVGYSTPGPLADVLSANGIPVKRLPRFGRVDPFLFLGILNLIHTDPPQVVHTHLFKSDFHGRLAARMMGVPVVISTLHNADIWAKKWPLGVLYGQTARFTDQMIAVSEEVGKYHIDHTGIPQSKVSVIHNGVDIKKFVNKAEFGKKIRLEFGIDEKSIVYGIIGRLKPQKDHATFLNAAIEIRKRIPNARFLVVGNGPLEDDLRRKASEAGLLPALIFTGLRVDIPEIIAALDVMVFSSRWEGLPVTLLEGMAASKPIAATAVDGIQGVAIQNLTALLVPPENPQALADACIRLGNDAKLRFSLGQAGFIRVSSEYNLRVMIDKTALLYNKYLSNHGYIVETQNQASQENLSPPQNDANSASCRVSDYEPRAGLPEGRE